MRTIFAIPAALAAASLLGLSTASFAAAAPSGSQGASVSAAKLSVAARTGARTGKKNAQASGAGIVPLIGLAGMAAFGYFGIIEGDNDNGDSN